MEMKGGFLSLSVSGWMSHFQRIDASQEAGPFLPVDVVDRTSDSVNAMRERVFPRATCVFCGAQNTRHRQRSAESWNSPAEVSLCCEARHDKNVPPSSEFVGGTGARNPGGNVSITTSNVGSITSEIALVPTFERKLFGGGRFAPVRAISNDCARSPRYLTKSNKRATFPVRVHATFQRVGVMVVVKVEARALHVVVVAGDR